jgi:RHS repeat-associated protein
VVRVVIAFDYCGVAVAKAGVERGGAEPVDPFLVATTQTGQDRVYVYDASGQRVAQLKVGSLASPAPQSATVYLGATEVTDADTASGSTGVVSATRFITFGGSTVATATAATGGPVTWSLLFGDVQGSAHVSMELEADTGETSGFEPASELDHQVARNADQPYGSRRGADALTVDRGWLGQTEDAGTGLTYLNARYYDPVLARFLSPDPLMNPGDPRTLDPYRYADNNPIVFVDPTGLCSEVTTGIVAPTPSPVCFDLGFPLVPTSGAELRLRVDNALRGAANQGANTAVGALCAAPLVTTACMAVRLDRASRGEMDLFTIVPPTDDSTESYLSYAAGAFLVDATIGALVAPVGEPLAVAKAVNKAEPVIDAAVDSGRLVVKGTPATRTPPNPWGRLGSPEHRAKIAQAEQRMVAQGWSLVAGGSRKEVLVWRRAPDLILKKGDREIAVQVGRVTKGGLPVARERRAIDDLRASDRFRHVFFLRYR